MILTSWEKHSAVLYVVFFFSVGFIYEEVFRVSC